MSQVIDHAYVPDGDTLKLFYSGYHEQRKFIVDPRGYKLPLPVVSFILGPVSSGKTRCLFERIFRHMQEAYPCRDGKRRTRWAIVRNSYPQIDLTTKKDFDSIFVDPYPDGHYGTWKKTTPSEFTFDFDDVWSEWVFLAFDDIESIGQAKSAQWTGVGFHETRYLLRQVVGNLIERTGRYPPKEEYMHNFPEGTPLEEMAPQWSGALGDSNMPDNQHWLTTMAGIEPVPAWVRPDERDAWEKPDHWYVYRQPQGLLENKDAQGKVIGYKPNPRAENQKWMPGGAAYYLSKVKEGKSYVDSQILNRPAPDRSGTPVHGDYNDSVHYTAGPITPAEGRQIVIGLDFGTCFAAELCQNASSTWAFFDELFLKGVSDEEAAEQLRFLLAERYPDHYREKNFILWCGDDGAFRDSRSANLHSHVQIFRKFGFQVQIAPGGNRLSIRRAAMDGALRRAPMGRPGVLVSSKNPMLRTGMQSGYVWMQTKDGAIVKDAVDKNKAGDYAHPVEAAHYALLGGGEGREALGYNNTAKKTNTLQAVNVFDRGKRVDVFKR